MKTLRQSVSETGNKQNKTTNKQTGNQSIDRSISRSTSDQATAADVSWPYRTCKIKATPVACKSDPSLPGSEVTGALQAFHPHSLLHSFVCCLLLLLLSTYRVKENRKKLVLSLTPLIRVALRNQERKPTPQLDPTWAGNINSGSSSNTRT